MIKENISIEELIEMHEKNNAKFSKIEFDGTEFYTYQLDFLYKTITNNKNIQYYLKVVFKYRISRRRALIVILQEYFFKESVYPEDMIFEYYENKANSRFIIENRDKTNFKTAQETHPKKPREYYEDKNHQMHQYIKSLELLCLLPDCYFEKKEAIEPFIKLYNDLIDK
jgi:hypothetical protein